MQTTLILAEVVALVGGTVHTLEPGEEVRPATILVEDGRIRAVGTDLELPPDCRVVDAVGLHLVPGLVDGLAYHDPRHDALYVAAGVTLLVDHGNDLGRIFEQREPDLRDLRRGPALHVAGAVLDGVPPATGEALILGDAHAAGATARRLAAEGVDFLAFHRNLPAEAWRVLIRLGPELGLQVWGPLLPGETALEASRAGQSGVVDLAGPWGAGWNGLEGAALDERLGAVADSGLAVIPLLASRERLLRVLDAEATEVELLGAGYAPLWRRFAAAVDPAGRPAAARSQQRLAALLVRCDAAGLTLLPGSGAPHPWLEPGRALHRELELWQAAGLEPQRVLRAATAGAARALGLEAERGRLAPGLVADVIGLRADPRVDVAALGQIELVLLRGTLIDRAELERSRAELAAEAAVRLARESAPVDVGSPPLPEGDVLLRGRSETRWLGGTIAVERWAVVRDAAGRLSFCGRALQPDPDGGDATEVFVRQRIQAGELDEFEVVMKVGGRELRADGVRTAGQVRVRRRFEGAHLDTRKAGARFAALDAGSVTTFLVLAHGWRTGRQPLLRFHEGLEMEEVRWELEVGEDGGRLYRTPDGGKEARFGPDGSLLELRQQRGAGLVWTRTTESEAVADGGLPLASPDDAEDAEDTGGGARRGDRRGGQTASD